MNWASATKSQLLNIFSNDKDCPTCLINGVVEELIKRDALRYFIIHIANKMFGKIGTFCIKTNMEPTDLIQLGYVGIWKAIKRFKSGKSSMKTFCYMHVKSEFTHLLDNLNSTKRKVYENMSSLDVPLENDGEETIISLLPAKKNVEREVIRKMEYESKIDLLQGREKEVVLYYIQGYSLSEMSKSIYKKKNTASLQKAFHRAMKKMGIVINLKTGVVM